MESKSKEELTTEEKDEIILSLIEKLDFTLNELFSTIGEEYLDIEMYLSHIMKIYKYKKRKVISCGRF